MNKHKAGENYIVKNILTKYYQEDEISWEKRNAYKMLSGEHETEEALEDLGTGRWVIVKWILMRGYIVDSSAEDTEQWEIL
jgi:hypothetical protein